jgi:ADP-heptose:LPS heptosyltransferase
MGYGDWIHWTSVIRDLYLCINENKTYIQKIECIIEFINKFKNYKYYGVIKYKTTNNYDPFKILITKIKKIQGEVFLNNPYITYDENYPNYVEFKLKRQDYYNSRKGFKDNIHVVTRYCWKLGLKNYKIKAEIYFSLKEKRKVKRLLKLIPKDFIFIQPTNYKIYSRYTFEKFQEIVNKLKDKITFCQVSPEYFKGEKTKLLENALHIIGKTTFRECVLLMKYAKLCLINESGLSVASNTVNAKTLAIYNSSFNPILTNYSNVIPIHIKSDDHYSCGIYPASKKSRNKYPDGCLKCQELINNHDTDIIVNKINEILNF